MAKSRCIPTQLFRDPDFCDLDSDTQCVYIGLTLEADDYGRGLAHVGLLARALNKPVEVITATLERLEAVGLISRYQVERYTYYHHTKWDEWQYLKKRTPSKYPVPPQQAGAAQDEPIPGEQETMHPLSSESAQLSQDLPGKVGLEEEGEEEEKKNTNRTEEDVETRPVNVTPFPTTHPSNNDSDAVSVDEKTLREVTQQIATILQLPETSALRRVVLDFLHDRTLSLSGEADMAREYIDDPRRNHRHKAMSPAFYRQWLKRERDQGKAAPGRQGKPDLEGQATGTTGSRAPSGLAGRSLMNLEAQYQGKRQRASFVSDRDSPQGSSSSHVPCYETMSRNEDVSKPSSVNAAGIREGRSCKANNPLSLR